MSIYGNCSKFPRTLYKLFILRAPKINSLTIQVSGHLRFLTCLSRKEQLSIWIVNKFVCVLYIYTGTRVYSCICKHFRNLKLISSLRFIFLLISFWQNAFKPLLYASNFLITYSMFMYL